MNAAGGNVHINVSGHNARDTSSGHIRSFDFDTIFHPPHLFNTLSIYLLLLLHPITALLPDFLKIITSY